MNLKKLNDDELVRTLKSKANEERSLTLEIIELLEEVDLRKIYLKRAYGSLLEFCIKELKYSESAAYRRISAMRITRDVPQAKESIQSGTLNIAVLSQAQTFLNQEKKYNNKTYTKKEKEDLIEQLEKIKNLYSHKNSNPNYSELIGLIADEVLKKEKRSAATPPGGVALSKKSNLNLSTHQRKYLGIFLLQSNKKSIRAIKVLVHTQIKRLIIGALHDTYFNTII